MGPLPHLRKLISGRKHPPMSAKAQIQHKEAKILRSLEIQQLRHKKTGSAIAKKLRNLQRTCKVEGYRNRIAELSQGSCKKVNKSVQKAYNDALQRAPSILFIENMDDMCVPDSEYWGCTPNKKYLRDCLINVIDEMDDSKVFVIGTTETTANFDFEVSQPGLFDKELHLLPDFDWNNYENNLLGVKSEWEEGIVEQYDDEEKIYRSWYPYNERLRIDKKI
uniref:ATPase AAA-type core domain-containing protein n=1 Tax=Ditylenchus dipsaci TaxID=166011 RepID=A0A915CWT2_9BILA